MCLLIYASPGATPTKKALRTAGSNNPDGFGWAFAVGHRIVRHRSMDLEETIESFHAMRAEHPKAHAMFHLRITTHGGTNLDNCHPFMVTDDIVLGHNGMLPIDEVDGKSDTRQFAEEWLPELGIKAMLDVPENFAELEKFARGSKLCVMSVNPELDKPVYLVNESDGHWDKGVWYSNNSYKYERVRSYVYGYGTGWNNYPKTYTSTERQTTTAYDSKYDDSSLFDVDNEKWWYDQETGELYQWDNKHGWVLFDDDDGDIMPEWCHTCQMTLGQASLTDGHYCWDCGHCTWCDLSYDKCYCGRK